MLTAYLRAAMRQARYEIVEDDGSFYGDIPGVRANSKTLEACREELESVLEGCRFMATSLASGRIPRHWRLAGKSWKACWRDGYWSALPITPRFRTSTATASRSAKSPEMPVIGPIKRKDFIACLRALGFEPPVSGGDHQYMKGKAPDTKSSRGGH